MRTLNPLLLAALLLLTPLAQAQDAVMMTCSWTAIKKNGTELIEKTVIPTGCITQATVDAYFDELGWFDDVHFGELIKRSQPRSCPDGYGAHPELQGKVQYLRYGIYFEAQRLCLSQPSPAPSNHK